LRRTNQARQGEAYIAKNITRLDCRGIDVTIGNFLQANCYLSRTQGLDDTLQKFWQIENVTDDKRTLAEGIAKSISRKRTIEMRRVDLSLSY